LITVLVVFPLVPFVVDRVGDLTFVPVAPLLLDRVGDLTVVLVVPLVVATAAGGSLNNGALLSG
jgi:hypothetical protein